MSTPASAESEVKRISTDWLGALKSYEAPNVFNPWSETDANDLHWGSGIDPELQRVIAEAIDVIEGIKWGPIHG